MNNSDPAVARTPPEVSKDFSRFDDAMKRLLSVSPEKVRQAMAREKAEKRKKKANGG